ITDNAAHVIIIRSDGIVVYTNSTATANADYIYGSGLDLVVDIDMNGNTFKSMTGDITADDYTVDNDAQIITFSKEFMATLDYGTNHAPKNHIFTVEWNPLGFTFVSGDDNEEPGKTIITITVKSPCESSHTSDNAQAADCEQPNACTVCQDEIDPATTHTPDTSANCAHCQNCDVTTLAVSCATAPKCAACQTACEHTDRNGDNCENCDDCGATELERICTSENPCAFHYEAPPIFEPCSLDCKGEGNCDEPCEPPSVFEPCGPDCKGEGECDEPCEFLIGDTNRDGKINIADLTYLKRVAVGYMPEIFVNRPECWLDPETRAEENPMPKAADITQLKDFLTGKISSFL
ncbi:MAG: hypothetical protein FWH05_07390, partial [Oscillospiraceae bacterium]|nr:hypothetical protein [Oscillospiraceae bacterium]